MAVMNPALVTDVRAMRHNSGLSGLLKYIDTEVEKKVKLLIDSEEPEMKMQGEVRALKSLAKQIRECIK